MKSEVDLATLVRAMAPSLGEDVYVFVGLPPDAIAPSGVTPVMIFREDEGVTLIVTRKQAEAAGLGASFPSRMITLTVHSALDAVGFLAAVAARLAAAGIAANPVSAFHHDHLFVPDARAEEALRILEQLARETPWP